VFKKWASGKKYFALSRSEYSSIYTKKEEKKTNKSTLTYGYNNKGDLIKKCTDGKDCKEFKYYYNKDGVLQKKEKYKAGVKTQTESYTYNKRGLLVKKVRDNNRSYSYKYDTKGRVIKEGRKYNADGGYTEDDIDSFSLAKVVKVYNKYGDIRFMDSKNSSLVKDGDTVVHEGKFYDKYHNTTSYRYVVKNFGSKKKYDYELLELYKNSYKQIMIDFGL